MVSEATPQLETIEENVSTAKIATAEGNVSLTQVHAIRKEVKTMFIWSFLMYAILQAMRAAILARWKTLLIASIILLIILVVVIIVIIVVAAKT